MNVVKELQRINQKELEKGYDAKASWCAVCTCMRICVCVCTHVPARARAGLHACALRVCVCACVCARKCTTGLRRQSLLVHCVHIYYLI